MEPDNNQFTWSSPIFNMQNIDGFISFQLEWQFYVFLHMFYTRWTSVCYSTHDDAWKVSSGRADRTHNKVIRVVKEPDYNSALY